MAERPESLRRRILLSFSASLILVLFAATLTGCVPVESTQQAQPSSESTGTPSADIGGPFRPPPLIYLGEEASSLVEAQSRVSFGMDVPRVVPGGYNLIWIGSSSLAEKAPGRGFTRLVYSDGEHHILVGQGPIEEVNLEVITDEWLKELNQQRVTIHGFPGVGHERTEREVPMGVVEGKTIMVPIQEPAAVRWWPPGLVRAVWTPDDMSITLADLIVMAESMEPVQ